MDIAKLLGLVSSIPKEKLKTDSGLKEVFREIGKKTGKSFTEQELNNYVSMFRHMARTENPSSLLNKLAQQGVNPNTLHSLKRRMK